MLFAKYFVRRNTKKAAFPPFPAGAYDNEMTQDASGFW
jgi:hypothetical protein